MNNSNQPHLNINEMIEYILNKYNHVDGKFSYHNKKCREIWNKDDYDYNLEKYEDDLNYHLDTRDIYENEKSVLNEIITKFNLNVVV